MGALASAPDELVDLLDRDGFAVVPSVVEPALIARLVDAVDEGRRIPGMHHRVLSAPGQAPCESDLFAWKRSSAFAELAGSARVVDVARTSLQCGQVALLEDQWFFSAAGSVTDSPWHQDDPYHPLDRPFLTIWIPLDEIPPGAGLRMMPGSHLGAIHAPVEFSAGKATLGQDSGFTLEPVPQLAADAGIEPAVKPGDAIILDSRTLHAAGGPCATDFRRVSLRYADADTRVRARPWSVASFWAELAQELSEGDRIVGPDFPLMPGRSTL